MIEELTILEQRELFLEQLQAKFEVIPIISQASDTELIEAIRLSQQLDFSFADFVSLIVAFVFGGFTSAFWTWRISKRKPTRPEIFSSIMVSGLFAVLVAGALRVWYSVPLALTISISILAGLGGDTVIRGTALKASQLWYAFLEVLAKKNTNRDSNES